MAAPRRNDRNGHVPAADVETAIAGFNEPPLSVDPRVAVIPSTFVTEPLLISFERSTQLSHALVLSLQGDCSKLESLSLHELSACDPDTGLTPLMVASMAGHAGCVSYLLHHAFETLDRFDCYHRTALFYALFNGHFRVANLLLDKYPNVRYADHQGWNLLHAVCGSLLFYPLEPESPSPSSLDARASSSSSSPPSILFRHPNTPIPRQPDADIDDNDVDNGKNNNNNNNDDDDDDDDDDEGFDDNDDDDDFLISDMIDMIVEQAGGTLSSLDYGNQDLLSQATKQGWTLLHLAVHTGDLQLVKYLTTLLPEHDGQTGELMSREALLQTEQRIGSMLARADAWGRTCLHLAACAHASEAAAAQMVDFVAERSAVLDARDCSGRTPLHVAAAFGHAQSVVRLFAGSAHVYNTCDNQGLTALHLAVLEGHQPVVAELLRVSAWSGAEDPNVADALGRTPLHLASVGVDRGAKLKILGTLLDSTAIDEEARDDAGCTALFCPLFLDNEQMACACIRKLLMVCDVRSTDRQGRCVLHYACYLGRSAVVECLLQEDRQLATLREQRSMFTPLHVCVLSRAADSQQCALKLLKAAPQSLTIPDRLGRTPLYLAVSMLVRGAVEQPADELFTTLLAGASSSAFFASTERGRTCLHKAMSGSHLVCAGLLLRACSQPTRLLAETDVHGYTPLHLLARARHTDRSALADFFALLASLCSVDELAELLSAADSIGQRTVLMLAIASDNTALAEQLVAAGAVVDERLFFFGLRSVKRPDVFVRWAASVVGDRASSSSSPSSSWLNSRVAARSLLDVAFLRGHADCFAALLELGAEPTLSPSTARALPALLEDVALGRRSQDHVAELLRCFAVARPDALDALLSSAAAAQPDGWTPLHAACMLKLTRLCRHLLSRSDPVAHLTSAAGPDRLTPSHLLFLPFVSSSAPAVVQASDEAVVAALADLFDMEPSHALLSCLDGAGRSVLHYAAYFGLERTLLLLLRSPHLTAAHVNQPDGQGLAPVFHALYRQHFRCAELLMSAPLFSFRSSNARRQTVLHLCAGFDQPSLCSIVLARESSLLSLPDVQQRTPLDYARHRRAAATTELLQRASQPSLGPLVFACLAGAGVIAAVLLSRSSKPAH